MGVVTTVTDVIRKYLYVTTKPGLDENWCYAAVRCNSFSHRKCVVTGSLPIYPT